MSVTIGPAEPIVPANNTVLLTNKTTSQFLGDEMGLALKSDVPTKTSELVNDSDFATNASVDEKIGGVTSSIPTRTSQLQNDSGFLTWGPNFRFGDDNAVSGYLNLGSDALGNSQIKLDGVNAKIDLGFVGSHWGEMNDSSHIRWNGRNVALEDNIPTKVSQLDNDSNFTTKTELDTVNQNLTTTVLDMQKELDKKATNASVDEKIGGVTSSIPTKVSQIENDSGYTTQAYVDNAIGNVLTQEEF